MENRLIFWNVDTQVDFVEPDGKLYAPGADLLKPVWKKITAFAAEHDIKAINSADYHYINSPEIDETPDMVSTFPPHCLAGSRGAEYVEETNPENPLIFNWNAEYDMKALEDDIRNCRNIVIRKDAFDVFDGNRYTHSIVEILKPQTAVVYGVTTNVCVDFAVVGLATIVPEVYVITDAIKELPNIPLPFDKWEKLGVKCISHNELGKLLP